MYVDYSEDEDFIFASAALRGKQPLCGQTMTAQLGGHGENLNIRGFVAPSALPRWPDRDDLPLNLYT